MYLSEISDLLCEQSGMTATGPNSSVFFGRVTLAVNFCAKQGLFDAQQFYLDLAVQPGQIVILPREVLTPIKITINRNPAFSRNRLYEFSLSGPGQQNGGLTGWQWMEQNTYPLLAYLPSIGSTLQVTFDPSDDDATISFFGLDLNNREISETITANGTGNPQTTVNHYLVMRRVQKSVTTKSVLVNLSDGVTAVANYYPDETNPQYRVIKLAKKATSIHMLFKCVTLAVKSINDYIPLDSADAVLYAFKAINLAVNSETVPSAEVEAFQKLAIQALQDEQKSRNAAAELAAANEVQPAFNLNTNNRDSLIAADVIDDVFDIFGPIGLTKAFDRITDACELGNNLSVSWEASEGYADLKVFEGGEITLPRTIWRPIKIRDGHGPLQMRNRFFEFHLNGWDGCNDGALWWDDVLRDSHHRFWDDRSISVTVHDPKHPFRVVAINDLTDDDGASLTVYGYDQDGKWIRTPNEDLESDNNYVDGYVFSANYSSTLPDPNSPVFSRITRVTRDQTDGYQQLLAYELNGNQEPIMIGYYYPDETEPNYSRIVLPSRSEGHPHWVRMRYKKRELKISCLTDNLHLNSRLAVVNLLNAVKSLKDDPKTAQMYKDQAKEFLQEAEAAKNPSQEFTMEVSESWASPLQGQY